MRDGAAEDMVCVQCVYMCGGEGGGRRVCAAR
jgi:hypothetical protein